MKTFNFILRLSKDETLLRDIGVIIPKRRLSGEASGRENHAILSPPALAPYPRPRYPLLARQASLAHSGVSYGIGQTMECSGVKSIGDLALRLPSRWQKAEKPADMELLSRGKHC